MTLCRTPGDRQRQSTRPLRIATNLNLLLLQQSLVEYLTAEHVTWINDTRH